MNYLGFAYNHALRADATRRPLDWPDGPELPLPAAHLVLAERSGVGLALVRPLGGAPVHHAHVVSLVRWRGPGVDELVARPWLVVVTEERSGENEFRGYRTEFEAREVYEQLYETGNIPPARAHGAAR